MFPRDERDPLADLLSGVMLPPADPLRREAIFTETRGVLRRRRLVRRALRTTSLAACYVVGALSVLGWQSIHHQPELAGKPGGVIGTSSATSPEDSNRPSDPSPARSPGEAQNAVARSTPVETLTTFEKLRRAGDRQLHERGNLQGALGCYRRALDFASDDELQIVPDRDSWLLIPLKENRLEARKHVHRKS